MGLFFKSNKKKDRVVVILDVGSGSVGGACAVIPKDFEENIPTILKSVRFEIKQNLTHDKNLFEKEAINTIKKVAQALYQSRIGKIDEVVCVITSPWCNSETKRVSLSNKKPFVLTKKILDELVTKETFEINQNFKKEKGESAELIEKLVTEVFVDDRSEVDPIGQKCQFLDLNLSYSYSSRSFIDKTREALSGIFSCPSINFSSFPILTYLMIRENFAGEETHLLLDIGSEVTDLSVINNGVFKQKYSFPFGKRTIFKHLALSLKIEDRDAVEIFKLYYHNELSASVKEKVKLVFNSIEKFWSEELKLCLNSIPKKHELPKVMFLTIDNDMRNWFFEVFKNTEFTNNITLHNKFRVIILDENEMIEMCAYQEGTHDPFLMIEAIALSQKQK